jgi:Domain of unknown function (DUF3854)
MEHEQESRSCVRFPLTPEHRERYLGGIIDEIIDQRGYASIPETLSGLAELKRLGFSSHQRRPTGLLIPHYLVTGDLYTHQFRSDSNPRTRPNGAVAKYENPNGLKKAIDCPPHCVPMLGDASIRLWICEGSRNADVVVSQLRDECAISLDGVTGWRGKNAVGGKVALPDWEFLALENRPVLIAFDDDINTNRNVWLAYRRLAKFLEFRGAKVKVINWGRLLESEVA